MQATTVAAQGEAKCDFNLAGFSVALDSLEESVPLAKAALKKKVESLTKALDAMKTKLDLEFVKNSIRSSSNVQPQYVWVVTDKKSGSQEQVLKGYQATYSYSFQIDDLDKVSKVYDTLTSLDEVRTGSPSYSIKDSTRERLNKKALKHAMEKVRARLDVECDILGLSPTEFEISNWETSYSDSHRSDRVAGVQARRASRSLSDMGGGGLESAVACAAPMGGGGDEDNSLELVAGQAQVTVNLEVGYARRTSAATTGTGIVKAHVVRESNGLDHCDDRV